MGLTRTFARLGSPRVAAHDDDDEGRAAFEIDDGVRLRRLKIVLIAALVCGLAISRRLWLSSPRTYPTAPVSDALPGIPFPLDYLWLAVVILLLAAVLVFERPRKFVVAFLVAAGLLCLWDQARWQPWFFQYYFMLAALCLAARGDEGGAGNSAALDACRMIVAATYFWGGAQKINYSFASEVMPALLDPYLRHLPPAFGVLPTALGVAAPLVEVCAGVGLLTRRFRRAACLLALTTSAAALALLVPVRANVVVWPWNAAMAAFVYILFWRDETTPARAILVGGKSVARVALLLLFGAMPLLSFFNLWDSYLSAALYSGNTSRAGVYVSDSMRERLPESAQASVRRVGDKNLLSLLRWSDAELNVPPYPEPRVYFKLARWVCARAETASDAALLIEGRPGMLDGARTSSTYDCGEFIPRLRAETQRVER
ncbi:MAG: DoxX family membrane protein [Acidobacteria bacterium]|nr:DoxX family membrane protein [Acidobacteriota bacterium]MCA1642449.1 DoxX family membrane protein [Acidobacteriota bacterium]